jgi:acetyl/propionyl-CoA carboxylase alpha subunit
MEVNMEIPVYYDNMIAKLIVWAPDRMEAISLMKQAINDYEVEGIKTTLPFGEFVMNHPAFISGNFDTHFSGSWSNRFCKSFNNVPIV